MKGGLKICCVNFRVEFQRFEVESWGEHHAVTRKWG